MATSIRRPSATQTETVSVGDHRRTVATTVNPAPKVRMSIIDVTVDMISAGARSSPTHSYIDLE